jgi:hypothetical protein
LTGYISLLVIITLPQRFQIVNVDSPIMTGIHLLPLLGGTAVGSVLGAAASKNRNNTFWTLLVASCLLIVGSGLLSTIPDSLKIPIKQYGFEVILGVGVGMTYSTVTVMTLVEAEFEDVGE